MFSCTFYAPLPKGRETCCFVCPPYLRGHSFDEDSVGVSISIGLGVGVTLSFEPVVGFLPNFRGCIIGT